MCREAAVSTRCGSVAERFDGENDIVCCVESKLFVAAFLGVHDGGHDDVGGVVV